MLSDAPPLCLFCGHAMNIIQTKRADSGLICFERQKLECPDCGGQDSRFSMVSNKQLSPNTGRSDTSLAEVQRSPSNPKIDEVSQPKETEIAPTNGEESLAANLGAQTAPPL